MKPSTAATCLLAVAVLMASPPTTGAPRAPIAPAKPPHPGFTIPCQIIDVHDGDTVTVRTEPKTMRIRLKDCWAPEVTGPQKPVGIKSRVNLQKFCIGRTAILNVPEVSDDPGDMTSMGRVLGWIWVNDINLSEKQVKDGFATKTKEESEEKFGPRRESENEIEP